MALIRSLSTSGWRRSQAVIALAASVVCLLVGAAQARCTGQLILPELTTSHPEIMRQVRAAADRIVNTEAILWRVERSGVAASHLFGTMHVSDRRIMAMPAAARDALDKARLVALEIADMSPGAMMRGIQRVPQLMVYTDGSRLDQKLSAAEFEQVKAVLTKSGMPAQMAAVIRPWMVGIALAVPACEQQRIASGATALDAFIGQVARRNKVPVVGLETIESQLQSLAGVPEADQLAMLRVSLAHLGKREDLFETLIQSYVKRDLGLVLELSKGLARIAGLKASGFAGFSRELIAKRNHEMFERSAALVEKGNSFIAVGAAHLIGDTGLVALFRKAGFTVTAVD